MESSIRERYSDPILQEILALYGVSREKVQLLGETESYVYEFERSHQSFILRVGHSLRRTESLILGEIDWINHLADGGVSVPQAVLSDQGNYVEVIDDGHGGQFLGTVFYKAPGRPAREQWTPERFASFGELLGRMHSLAQGYQPAQPGWKRPAWDDDLMNYPARYLPASEDSILGKYQLMSDHLRMLPTDNECYGLVHFDAHGGNCLVDEDGNMSIIDFDDCTYSWYANDLAIALGYLALDIPDASEQTRALAQVLDGYLRVHPLDRKWLEEFPIFLKMGEIFGYAVVHRDILGANHPDPGTEQFLPREQIQD